MTSTCYVQVHSTRVHPLFKEGVQGGLDANLPCWRRVWMRLEVAGWGVWKCREAEAVFHFWMCFPHPRRVFVRVAHAQILRAAPKNNAPGMGIQAVEVEKTLRWKAKKELIHIISRTTKHFAMAARDQRKAAQKHDEFRIRLLFYPSAVAPLV